jgi:nanoRNase/pAp phosphatase (c-di-AMP/oligoRNAs hydrolase)
MVQQLKIKLTHIDDIQWHRYKLIAMVDTQPEFKNHGLPDGIKPTMVIDHHKGKVPVHADFADIRTNYGASATMLLEYIAAAELEIPARIATAIAYAIRSETQELGRDASKADIDAYLEVYPKANKRVLSKINHPKLPKSYFILIVTALERAKMFRQLALVHLGDVESPESVALIADLLLRHERMSWSLVTGRYKKKLFLSLRCNRANANAGKCLGQIIGSWGYSGGHAQIAGGHIPFEPKNEKDWQNLEETITERFSIKVGTGKEIEWKSFLANGLKNN